MSKNSKTFQFYSEGKCYTLTFNDVGALDIGEAVNIHHENIIAESIAQPALLFQIGVIRANALQELNQEEMLHKHNIKGLIQARDKAEADAHLEYYANGAKVLNEDGTTTVKKVTDEISKKLAKVSDTVQRLENEILEAENNKALEKAKLDYAILDSAYWAIKEKGEHIKIVRGSISAEEATSSFNTVDSVLDRYGLKL